MIGARLYLAGGLALLEGRAIQVCIEKLVSYSHAHEPV